MKLDRPVREVRQFRDSKLYRPLARTLRVYNRRLIEALHARGFSDFSPAFPPLLSNLDTRGTRIGVLALRAGVTRQAAGQLLREIERAGYVQRRPAPEDARASIIQFTPRGRELLANVLELVGEIEAQFAEVLGARELERVRVSLSRLADAIDPSGAFGSVDEKEDV